MRTARAFTLVELLVSVAIGAMLLTSLAAAFNASLLSYDENGKIAQATQTARAVLDRIADEVRTADAVQCYEHEVQIIPPENAQGLTLIRYASSGLTVQCSRTVGATTTTSSLLGGGDVSVTDFSVQWVMGTDANGVSCTRSVTVHLGLSAGGRAMGATRSASPRRNLAY